MTSYTEEDEDDNSTAPVTPSKRGRKKAVKEEIEGTVQEAAVDARKLKAKEDGTTPKKNNLKTPIKAEEGASEAAATPKSKKRKVKTEEEDGEAEAQETPKVKKPRKTKEQKEEEMVPIASRTAISTLKRKIYIGAHVSAAGGVDKSIQNATHIGANAFALFLKSQRKWVSPPLADEARDAFTKNSKEQDYDAGKFVLPHGSYLVNLAQKEKDKATQAYDCFLDDLKRCDDLGIKLYNFHPGNTGKEPRDEAIGRIAAQLNKAHKATKSVITVLENMAGQGNTIGSTFEDLRDVIALVEDKSRVGVCIDTCHSFAAGYDLRTPATFKLTMERFDEIVGLQYLKAVHLNDSKAPFESNRDLHANIGTGFLGLRAFHNIVNSPIFENMPMVLETPIDKKGEDGKAVEDKGVWATEIKLLESLIGMDVESDEYKIEEARLWDLGKGERERLQGQADRKKEKGQKTLDAMFKKGKAKKKNKGGESDAEDSDSGCSH